MPVILIFLGVLMIIVAVNGTEHKLAAQVRKDFSGDDSFVHWIVAIVIIGFIGYIPGMSKVSTLFLTLCILVFVISNSVVFDNLKSEFGQ